MNGFVEKCTAVFFYIRSDGIDSSIYTHETEVEPDGQSSFSRIRLSFVEDDVQSYILVQILRLYSLAQSSWTLIFGFLKNES